MFCCGPNATVLARVARPAWFGYDAHAGSRTRVTSMGGLYDAATLHALKFSQFAFAFNVAFALEKLVALAPVSQA